MWVEMSTFQMMISKMPVTQTMGATFLLLANPRCGLDTLHRPSFVI